MSPVRERGKSSVDACHAELAPVKAYAARLTKLKGERHWVVNIPEGSAAHRLGYRYASIPNSELEYYEATGAKRVTP